MSYFINIKFTETKVLLRALRNVCWCHNQKLNQVNSNKYYVVIDGKLPGLYTSWEECEKQVKYYSKSHYKSFTTKECALLFMKKELEILKEFPFKNKSSINILENIMEQHKHIWYNEYSKLKKLSDASNFIESQPQCLSFDEEGYLEVYTDGSCFNNGKDNALAAVGVYFGEGSELNTSSMVEAKSTNNVAEIQAVIAGLSKARDAGFEKVKILTDSEYVMLCLRLWIRKWKANGWKKLNGNPVLNKNELIQLDDIVSEMDVKWVHVPGHKDVKGNIKADQLARSCIQNFKKQQQRTSLD